MVQIIALQRACWVKLGLSVESNVESHYTLCTSVGRAEEGSVLDAGRQGPTLFARKSGASADTPTVLQHETIESLYTHGCQEDERCLWSTRKAAHQCEVGSVHRKLARFSMLTLRLSLANCLRRTSRTNRPACCDDPASCQVNGEIVQ